MDAKLAAFTARLVIVEARVKRIQQLDEQLDALNAIAVGGVSDRALGPTPAVLPVRRVLATQPTGPASMPPRPVG
jgi:hypothetical protein